MAMHMTMVKRIVQVVFLVSAVHLSASAGDGVDLSLQVCSGEASQKFSQTAAPSNLPVKNKPAGAIQFVEQPSIEANGHGCTNVTNTTTDCAINVDAWKTTLGARVWVNTAHVEEPAKELNRVWVLTSGSIMNPASTHCADAKDGVNAQPSALLELTACSQPNSSEWIYSDVDGTISQKARAGGYPGLCMTVAVNPPPSPPTPKLPPIIDVSVTVPDASNSTTSETMVSFNFDWHANSEETPLWINMSAMILDLNQPILRQAAKTLSPAVLRLGGSEGDVVCYDVPTHNSTCASMSQNNTLMCLSMPRYEEIATFAKDTGLKFVFGLNAVWGRQDHNLNNPLDMTNIEALLAYTAENKITVYGFELGNEKCGPPPALFAKDYHNLHSLMVKYWPDATTRPLLIGNDCNTNPKYLTSFLPLVAEILDVTTYHHYDGYGLDPHLVEKMTTPAFLDSTVSADINSVHAQYAPNSQLWVGEAAAAWHSGGTGVTNAFISSFWWSDALGALSAHNHTGYCRQTLIGGNYGLLNRTNFEPNPDFYIAKLFHDLMGDVVLSPELNNTIGRGYLRAYANCHRGGDGVTMMIINIAPNSTFNVHLDAPSSMELYVLTANELSARYIMNNGELLGVIDGNIPTLTPKQTTSDVFAAAPHSISFVVLPHSQLAVCSK